MIVRGLVRLPRLRILTPSWAVPATGRRWTSSSCGKSYGDEGGGGRRNRAPFWGSTALALGVGATVLLYQSEKGKLVAEEESNAKTVVLGERKEGLPEFSMEEVGWSNVWHTWFLCLSYF